MKSKTLDILGFSAAGLCFLHCLIFPVLLILPLGIVHNAYIDLGFFILGTGIVYRLTQKIRNLKLKILFWISISCIGISVWMDLLFHKHLPLIHIGAILLMIAHIINYKMHQHTSK